MFRPVIGAEYPKKIIPLLDSAKKSIDVIVYDWRWYENEPAHAVQRFNTAFVRAVYRGVRVRAIVNVPLILPTLKSVGIRARVLKDKRTLHSKFILVDDEVLVIGSHNFTRNAFCFNIETSVMINVPDDVSRFTEFFENLYNFV